MGGRGLIDGGQRPIVLELDEEELCFPGLLVDQVVVVLKQSWKNKK